MNATPLTLTLTLFAAALALTLASACGGAAAPGTTNDSTTTTNPNPSGTGTPGTTPTVGPNPGQNCVQGSITVPWRGIDFTVPSCTAADSPIAAELSGGVLNWYTNKHGDAAVGYDFGVVINPAVIKSGVPTTSYGNAVSLSAYDAGNQRYVDHFWPVVDGDATSATLTVSYANTDSGTPITVDLVGMDNGGTTFTGAFSFHLEGYWP